MGQRSQIYIRYREDNKSYLIARYYQWNYGERMISRCRYTLEWIKKYLEYDWYFKTDTENLKRIMDVNFDMKDIVFGSDIVDDYYQNNWESEYPISDFVFYHQSNNDGKLFIDIFDGIIKYAFLDCEYNLDCIMDAESYINWDFNGWIKNLNNEERKICKQNINEISKIAELMTKTEIVDFINDNFCNVERNK